MTSLPMNPRMLALSEPPIPSIRSWAQDFDERRGQLIDLAQAVPGYSPHPELLEALASAAGSPAAARYGEIAGEAALRQVYAEHLNGLYGCGVEAAHVHVTAGCNQAFAAAVLALIGPGERVALLRPFYFNHETTLKMLGIESVQVECHPARGYAPELADIERALSPDVRALVLITPNNPTGAVYPPQLLTDLLELCSSKGVWLLLDETYRDFLPHAAGVDQAPHALFSHASWGDNVVGLYSFSKSFCIPGHRLGALTASPAVIAQVSKVMDNLQICAPRSPQWAVAQCFDALAAWREANRVEIATRAECFRQALNEAPGWRVESLGAYFAYVKHPYGAIDSVRVAQRLAAEQGILTVPGGYFGRHQEGHLRMAFANAGAETLALLGQRLRATA